MKEFLLSSTTINPKHVLSKALFATGAFLQTIKVINITKIKPIRRTSTHKVRAQVGAGGFRIVKSTLRLP